MIKKRLDHLVQELYPQFSKRQIQSWIMQGLVLVNDKPEMKSGALINPDALLRIKAVQEKFVSRAGYKLEHALSKFNLDMTNYTVMDAGISTGGFTDCLLQHGAQKIYGIDVGYGQVAEKIRTDNRVILFEKTNLRNLEKLPELVDLITLDLSFISVLKVIDRVKKLLKPEGFLIVLIKPQFEAQRHEIGPKGIIKDPAIHERITHSVIEGITHAGFNFISLCESPILGATGNKEFLALFKSIQE